MATPTRWPLRHLLVAGCALAVYAALAANPLLHDAPIAIERNDAVQRGPILRLFAVDFWGAPPDAPYASGSYRPLVSLTFALQARLTGNAAWSFHIVDMLLHALGAALLLSLLERLGVRPRHALPAALVYAVHPLISDAVCSVVGRADLLAALFLFTALLARNAGTSRPLSHAVVLASLAAALLSKEYAVTFPFVLVLVDVVAGRGRERSTRLLWLAAIAILVAYLGLRVALIGSLGGVGMLTAADHPLFEATLAVRWAMALRLGLLALRLLVWPWPLNHFYRYGTFEIVDGFLAPAALAGLAALIVLTALSVWLFVRRRDGLPLVALALVALPLAPSLNTVSVAGVLFAERFMVVPVAGLALLLGWLLDTIDSTRGSRAVRVAHVVVLFVALAFAAVTIDRVRDWSSAERLARSSLAGYPGGAEVWDELGVALATDGRYDEAADAYARSVELRPGAPRTWMNYALTLGRLGRHAEAAAAWRKTVELSPPDLGLLWRGLGEAELAAGDPDAAVAALERAATLLPEDGATRDSLTRARRAQAEGLRRRYDAAIAADAAGRHEEAIALYREILAIAPDHPPTLFNLGRALVTVGRPEEAIEPLRRGLALRDEPRARALLNEVQ